MLHCHSCDLIKQNTHYKLKKGNCREKRNNITFISDHNLALESILKDLKPTLVYEYVMYLLFYVLDAVLLSDFGLGK